MANHTERQYIQKTQMNGRVYRPLIQVSFHTETGVYHAKAKTLNAKGEALNPNEQLITVNTQKQMDAPAGFFTMNLVGVQWHERLNAQDITIVQMGYIGEARLTTVMVGLVDKVGRKRAMGADGTPSVNTIVTGRDFGKLFVKDLLKFYPEISGKNAADFFLTDVGWINLMKVFTTDSIMKGTPAVIIDNIMRHIFPKLHDVKWKLWNERAQTPSSIDVKATQIVRFQLGKSNFFMPFIFTADQYEGALWNLLERAAPKPFMELFIDTRDGHEAWNPTPDKRLVPHDIEKDSSAPLEPAFEFGQDGAKVVLCLRETPYDSVHRSRLIRHEIAEEDIITDDLSKGDEQHYNLFWAGSTINPLGIDLKRVAPPLLNEQDAKKYGLSPLEVNIEGMEITDGLVLEGMSKTYTGKLKEWYQHNHTLWSGTIEIRGNAKIRIGHLVEFGIGASRREYYVEGVSHSFTMFQGWTTTLTLTRGMKPKTLVDSSKHVWAPPAPPPKPQTASAQAATTASSFYTVQRGDTLWAIAKQRYNDPLKWRVIWEANKTVLIQRDSRNASTHGHYIYPGQKLMIPKG